LALLEQHTPFCCWCFKKENAGNKQEKSRNEKDKDGAWTNALKAGVKSCSERLQELRLLSSAKTEN